jgi:ribosomal protein L12E/L44/L45/RPP1/RPP2
MSTLVLLALLGLSEPTRAAAPAVLQDTADGGQKKEQKKEKKKDRDEKTEEELLPAPP